MKLKTAVLASLVSLASLTSTYARASSDFQCYFSQLDQEPIAIIDVEHLPETGNLTVTQDDAHIAMPEYSDYKFSAKVENNRIVGGIVISALKLENTKLGVAAETTDLAYGQFKHLKLTVDGKTFEFQCFLNIL